jgi:hypothetical protein
MLSNFRPIETDRDPPPAEAFEASAALRSRLGDLMMAACAVERNLAETPGPAVARARADHLQVLASHLKASADHVVRLAELCGRPS